MSTSIPPLEHFDDVHSHSQHGPRVLTSIEPHTPITTAPGEAWYSVGIHPWSTGEPVTPDMYAALDAMAADPRVAAIGECGLDALCGADAVAQEEVYRHHAALAERLGKPLIIHCVRRYGRIMEFRRELAPAQPWLIHGFRGKPELARQLVRAGFLLSLADNAPAELRQAIPPEKTFRETD